MLHYFHNLCPWAKEYTPQQTNKCKKTGIHGKSCELFTPVNRSYARLPVTFASACAPPTRVSSTRHCSAVLESIQMGEFGMAKAAERVWWRGADEVSARAAGALDDQKTLPCCWGRVSKHEHNWDERTKKRIILCRLVIHVRMYVPVPCPTLQPRLRKGMSHSSCAQAAYRMRVPTARSALLQ